MRKLLFVPLLLVCMAAGCADTLRSITEGLNKAAVSVGEVQGIIIAAWENDVITKEKSDDLIAGITVPVLSAIGTANGAVALLVARDEVDRDEILEILPPVIEALKEALADEKIGLISNAGTKAAVQLGLQAVVSALSTIQVIAEEE